jgi:hypothetical protein
MSGLQIFEPDIPERVEHLGRMQNIGNSKQPFQYKPGGRKELE